MTMFMAMQSAVEVLSSVTASLIQFMSPKPAALEIVSEADAIIKRHRLLREMDFDTLSTYDDMSLDDVDYVII